MGRSNPHFTPPPPQSIRRAQRAKEAKHIINTVIPALLKSDARARKGVDAAWLVVEPQLNDGGKARDQQEEFGKKRRKGKAKGRRKGDEIEDEDEGKGVREEMKGKPSKKIPKAHSTQPSKPPEESSAALHPPEISIHVTDTLTCARTLYSDRPPAPSLSASPSIALLNMASPLRPGGGVFTGATSQEEHLCTRTTLLPGLREEWYRLPELGVVFSPDVLVWKVRAEALPKPGRFYVDVLSAGVERWPDVEDAPARLSPSAAQKHHRPQTQPDEAAAVSQDVVKKRYYASAKTRALTLSKMHAVLRTSALHSRAHTLILGAWGCGAYGHPVGEIAALWRRAIREHSSALSLCPEYRHARLRRVVFAIANASLAGAFARAWGPGIGVVEYAEGEAGEEGESDSEDAIRERRRVELEGKIGELETQMRESRFPERVRGVLEALRRQRGEMGGASAANEEEEEEEEDGGDGEEEVGSEDEGDESEDEGDQIEDEGDGSEGHDESVTGKSDQSEGESGAEVDAGGLKRRSSLERLGG